MLLATSTFRARLAVAATVAAIVLPTLVVHWVVVGYAVFAQLVSVALWGLAVAAWAAADGHSRVPWRMLAPLIAALLMTLAGVAMTWWRFELPAGPLICAAGLLVTCMAVAATGARVGSGPLAIAAQRGLGLAFVVTAAVGTAIAMLQILWPDSVDGFWLAKTASVGRAGGNLLQPNHLATMLIWGLLAMLTALQGRRISEGLASLAATALVFGIALTASRGALLTIVILGAWGMADRRLRNPVRAMLVTAPLACLLLHWALPFLIAHSEAAIAAGGLMRASARSGAFDGALSLIQAYPWLGVGWGEFGLAWALAPQTSHDGRLFDHSHNLVLNLLVELGVPLGVVICTCLLAALVRVCRLAMAARREGDATPSFALAMLLAIGIHSMAEMPLWFAYLLLPTAWIWGAALARTAPGRARQEVPGWQAWLPLGLALSVGAFIVFADFMRALPASLPLDHPMPLQERVEQGRQSKLFRHLADHLAATRLPDPDLATIRSARHVVIDGALMTAWVKALARGGRTDEARLVADRLKAVNATAAPSRRSGAQSEAASPDDAPRQGTDWRNLR